jgi:polyisoprenoid-binding protein YceI
MRWEIDPNHTTVTISAKHMMITTVRGTVRVKSGWVEFDERDPEHGRVEVELDAASVNTGVEMRDNDMRSERFLDVANHPTITFKSTDVEQRDDRHARIVGDLTIRGVTRQVALETEFQGRGKSPWNDERISFTATTTIDRRDWGMVWNLALETGGILVGNEFKIELEVQAKAPLPAASEPTPSGATQSRQ